MKDGELKALAQGLVPFVHDVIAEATAPLIARIAELEARPSLEDAGVWDQAKLYRPGHVTTHDGSAWVCKEANSNARPGTSNAWRLMVKSKGRG